MHLIFKPKKIPIITKKNTWNLFNLAKLVAIETNLNNIAMDQLSIKTFEAFTKDFVFFVFCCVGEQLSCGIFHSSFPDLFQQTLHNLTNNSSRISVKKLVRFIYIKKSIKEKRLNQFCQMFQKNINSFKSKVIERSNTPQFSCLATNYLQL